MNHPCCGEWKYCPYCGMRLNQSLNPYFYYQPQCQPFNPHIYANGSAGSSGTLGEAISECASASADKKIK